MLTPGLVTVTFRRFSRQEICDTAQKAGLSLLEWGGDIHVPPEDPDAARDALTLTKAAGLTADTYGSYYRCTPEEDPAPIVRAAEILGVRNVRIWAGRKGSRDADEEDRASVAAAARKLCAMVPEGVTVSAEFHQGTLTDHYESALRLWEEVAAPNFRLYWQPNQFMDDDYNLAAVRAVAPHLSNVHVFTWAGNDKFPLADGERLWRRYLDTVRESGGDHGLLLEFVCDETADQLYRDAETLREWLEKK